ISRGLVFQLILTLLLPPIMGVSGVFLSLPLAEVMTLILLVMILLGERYKPALQQQLMEQTI
ncbi:MAG: hypothetical protein ACRCST_13455, partial [Turicibacter sp.]